MPPPDGRTWRPASMYRTDISVLASALTNTSFVRPSQSQEVVTWSAVVHACSSSPSSGSSTRGRPTATSCDDASTPRSVRSVPCRTARSTPPSRVSSTAASSPRRATPPGRRADVSASSTSSPPPARSTSPASWPARMRRRGTTTGSTCASPSSPAPSRRSGCGSSRAGGHGFRRTSTACGRRPPAAASGSTPTPPRSSATARRPPSARCAGSVSSSTPSAATPQTPAPSRRCRARRPGVPAYPSTHPTPTSQEKHMGSIRVAIVGVGNCASSLVQGVHYYRDADPTTVVPGLMHVSFGEYHVRDVEFVAAFDVDDKKVGKDLAEAINASENNTIKIADVPTTGVTVQRGTTLDGLGKYYRLTIDESGAEPVDVVAALRDAQVDVLVSYLPVGSEQADKFYAQCAIDAGVAFVNALPVFIASDPEWAAKFEEAGVPVIGDDIKSQVGATITHRVLAKLFEDRGVQLDRTYQLNFGGNTDFLNMLERERLESKKISKTSAVTSNLQGELAGKVSDRNVHIGPSDYVAWLDDRKWAYVRLEGRAFGDVPLNLEYKLEVWDSPNSAGIIIDAIRAAKIAKDRGVGGPLLSASSYLMKSPPEQRPDDLGRAKLEAFIRGEEER